MNFQLQRFAGAAPNLNWTVEELSTNRWKATRGDYTVIISGISNLEDVGAFALIATLAGELKDVTYTLDSVHDVDLQIGEETYTMKAGVTNGKFVEDDTDEAGEVVSTSIINKTKRADGKVISKTLNFINPAASDNDISTFMAALNSLSKNETIKGGTIIVEKRVL